MNTLPRQIWHGEGVAFFGFGEDVFEEQGATGLDGGEAIFWVDVVNGFTSPASPTAFRHR